MYVVWFSSDQGDAYDLISATNKNAAYSIWMECYSSRYVNGAVKKGFGDDACDEAEHYITDSYCDDGDDWEIDDEEYDIHETEVDNTCICETGTIKELEDNYYYIDETLE